MGLNGFWHFPFRVRYCSVQRKSMLVEANGQGGFLKKDQQLREITLSTRGTLLCWWIFALTTGRAPAKPLGSRAGSVPLTLVAMSTGPA